MSLIKSNTKWILFLAASSEPEDRHIMDLAFGVQSLETAGVIPSDIFIYIDGSNRTLISQHISNGTKNKYTIKESKDFFLDQASNTHENLVIFVTGHGGIEGIDAPTPITPYALLRCIKSTPNLKKAIAYLGQCYAGIFNYIGAGRGVAGSPAGADVILIGATNLNESLSTSTTEKLVGGDTPWLANSFLLHVFKWITSPLDIDGDGKITVIDSYKYAGALSNNTNKAIKIGSFVRSLGIHQKWEAAKAAEQASPTIQNKVTLQAIEEKYEAELGIHHVNQECWILNSIPAQGIEF